MTIPSALSEDELRALCEKHKNDHIVGTIARALLSRLAPMEAEEVLTEESDMKALHELWTLCNISQNPTHDQVVRLAKRAWNDIAKHLRHLRATKPRALPSEGIYAASRTHHGDMWKRIRAKGNLIISSWIDECGAGETEDFSELWARILREVSSAKSLLLYIEPNDFPLKGALIEVGAALMLGKQVVLCAPGIATEGRTMRPFGSWILHKNVTRIDDLNKAILSLLEKPQAVCGYCRGKGYVPGDPEGAPIEDCPKCGKAQEPTQAGEK